MKLTKNNINKVVHEYDDYYRGGTGRGLIDDELIELLYEIFAKGKDLDKALVELQ